MKTIRLLLITALATVIVTGAAAQNIFFPTKPGTVSLYSNRDSKDKVTSYLQQTVKDVEGSGGNLTISCLGEVLNKDKKPTSDPPAQVPYKIAVRDWAVILDITQMFADAPKDKSLNIKLSGVPMELPGDLQPGQSLKDSNLSVSVDMGMIKINAEMKMTDGKCLAIEEVTVPGGTFTCHKVTQTITITIMKKNIVSRIDLWLVPGVGSVKAEIYDRKGKLQGRTELEQLNNQ